MPALDYDLGSTLDSGQAFVWTERNGAWEGVIGEHWVRLSSEGDFIRAETVGDPLDWQWLRDYLQSGVCLGEVVATFPTDPTMQAAIDACRGLRLLRQDPWECLASFICSSTKQIVQIREIVRLLSSRLGTPVCVPDGRAPAFAFPSAPRIAGCTEGDLRACKMGFRAPYLLAAARAVAGGTVDLAGLHRMAVVDARSALMSLPGVGPKIADCVLLFAYGMQQAFPMDVWIERVLRRLYFPRARRMTRARLERFVSQHFGPNAGYAQQYLFHYARVHQGSGLEKMARRG